MPDYRDAAYHAAKAQRDQAWAELCDGLKSVPKDVKDRLMHLCNPELDRRELLVCTEEEFQMVMNLASTALGEVWTKLYEREVLGIRG